MPDITIPCATCSGTDWATHEDRHTETRQDQSRACGGTGQVPARPGESRETSWLFAVTGAESEERALDEAATRVHRDIVLVQLSGVEPPSQSGGTRGSVVGTAGSAGACALEGNCFSPVLSLNLLNPPLKRAKVLHIAICNAVHELEQAEDFVALDHPGSAELHDKSDRQVSHRVEALAYDIGVHAQLHAYEYSPMLFIQSHNREDMPKKTKMRQDKSLGPICDHREAF